MKPSTIPSGDREAALSRAIIRAIPEYYAWPEAEQEQYRLNVSRGKFFRIRQSLLKTLFDINTNSEEQLDDAMNEFNDEQYLILNSTLLPFQGIGKNNFFLNEHLADGVTLLDFPTLGDYARDDHHYQQQVRKREDPAYKVQAYRGDLFPSWARLRRRKSIKVATLGYSGMLFQHEHTFRTGGKVSICMAAVGRAHAADHGGQRGRGSGLWGRVCGSSCVWTVAQSHHQRHP